MTNIYKNWVLILSIFVGFLCLGAPLVASADTNFSGVINSDTTWTSADSPIITYGITVNSGATLTIEEGVVVKFNPNATIQVNGTLNTSGTSINKVYFTSITDDVVGGDSNADGNITTPTTGYWQGVRFGFGSVGNFSNSVIRYAGSWNFNGSGGIYNNGGDIFIKNSTITESEVGVLHWGGNIDIDSSDIGNQGINLYFKNGSATVTNTRIHDATQYGMIVHPQSNLSDLTLNNNSFIDNAMMTSMAVYNVLFNFTHSGNTASGNGLNGWLIAGAINDDKTWTAGDLPYILDGEVLVNANATLTLDPGVIVKFNTLNNNISHIDVNGTLNALGTATEKIYFTSLNDDTVGGDTNNNGSATVPAPGDWRNIRFLGSGVSRGVFDNVVLKYGGFSTFLGNTALVNYGGDLTISNSTIADNLNTAIYQNSGNLTIISSEIKNHDIGLGVAGGMVKINGSTISNTLLGIGSNNPSTPTVDAKNNYWGDPTGPYNAAQNPGGLGNGVSGNVDFIPFLTSDPFGVTPPPTCTVDCNSSVLFLPGVMGSRLYEQSGQTEKELWVSSSDSNQSDLALDDSGKSINSTIYTKNDTQKLDSDGVDETGIVDDIYSFNIYQSFINDLRKWKDNDKIIADYDFIPYDWRLSLDDIINNGVATSDGHLSYNLSQNFSNSFILSKLKELQTNSRTGKVTIIAHSNGGLVAKALIQKLKDTNDPLYDQIDKVIFVGVPQIGTPEAVVDLLHGSDIGAGFIMDADRSRQLSENMPAIYNLLPSESYFSTVDPAFAVDKLASFQNTPFFTPQTSQYGVFISNATELRNYILGTDSRTKPSFGDTVHPNIGNSNLYLQAENVHQVLDSWQPSSNTKVIQVAGWGEETLAGLDYESIKDTTEHLSYKPRMVVDGDGTVVVPSALWMPTSANVERWWVNLPQFNGNSIIKTVHRDILEVPNLRDFVKSEITSSAFNDPNNIVVGNTTTLISSKSRLHYTLHSPLTLGIRDSQGRYTGMDPVTYEIKQEIPDVTYKQIGDVKFISAPADLSATLQLKGYQQGSFSLDIDKQDGNLITSHTTFEGMPSTTSTIATINIEPNMDIGTSILKIDQNGDGTIDKSLTATPEGTTFYDITPPELKVSFDINTKDVVFSAEDNTDQNPTVLATKDSIKLSDSSGNTTIIPFIKYKEIATRLRFSYNKIIRNGVTTTIPNTNIIYDWQEKKGALTDLDTKVTIKGEEKYVFNYKKASNTTVIKDKKGKDLVTTTKSGFVGVVVKTEGDNLKVSY